MAIRLNGDTTWVKIYSDRDKRRQLICNTYSLVLLYSAGGNAELESEGGGVTGVSDNSYSDCCM